MSQTVCLQLKPLEMGLAFLLLLSGVIYAATASMPAQMAGEPRTQTIDVAELEGAALAQEDWTKAGLSKTDVIFRIRRGEAVG